MPTVQSNNVNLYYEIHGEGQPLLFIHGLGSCTQDWESQVQAFSKTYKVITFDLRGHGQSDKPAGPYSMSMFAADTAGLLKALGIQSAHVVGLSIGGSIIFQLAIDFPSLVKTATIVNSTHEVFVHTLKNKLGVWLMFTAVRLLGMRNVGKILGKRLLPKESHATVRAAFIERWAKNNPQNYLDGMRAMLNWSMKDKLDSIKCPTLVISADQDDTPVAVKEEYTRLIPNAQLVIIPDAHHGLPVEHPEIFNATLMDFLVKHS